MGECGILAFGGAWIPIARRRVGLRLSILSYLHHALSRLVDSTAPAEERPLQLYRIHAGCEGPGAAAVTSAPPSGPLLACTERCTSRYHSVEIHPWSFTRSCLIGLIAHSALEHPPSRSARRVCRQLEKTRCALFSMGICFQTLYPPCTGISEVLRVQIDKKAVK